MFSKDEAAILKSRLMLILEAEKAGKAGSRDELAAKLVEEARTFLAGRYNTNFGKDNAPEGITKLSDVIGRDDFAD